LTVDPNRQQLRLRRQFALMERRFPRLRGFLLRMQDSRWRLIRIPFGILLIVGSVLAVLPFLGLWMLPVGLLLLAVDVPLLRPATTSFVIRSRRRITLWQRRFWRDRDDD
jgi:hypothetical protein